MQNPIWPATVWISHEPDTLELLDDRRVTSPLTRDILGWQVFQDTCCFPMIVNQCKLPLFLLKAATWSISFKVTLTKSTNKSENNNYSFQTTNLISKPKFRELAFKTIIFQSKYKVTSRVIVMYKVTSRVISIYYTQEWVSLYFHIGT